MIVLLRHGETVWNLENRFLSRTDVPLSKSGERAARRLRTTFRDLDIRAVFTSPARRALKTAKLVVPHLSPIVVDELREVDFGDWEGATIQELQQRDPQSLGARALDPAHFRPPQGESFADVAQRVAAFALATQRSDEGTLIVGHRGTLSVLERLLRGVPLDDRTIPGLHPLEFRALAGTSSS